MNNYKHILFSAVLCLLSSIVIICVIPAEINIWKDYRVLAVEKNADEHSVLQALTEAGFDTVIARINQIPPVLPKFAPVQPDLSDYLKQKELFFFDESGEYALYYIPDTGLFHKKISDALKNKDFSWFIDHKNNFNNIFIYIIICFILGGFSILCAVFNQRKNTIFTTSNALFSWNMPAPKRKSNTVHEIFYPIPIMPKRLKKLSVVYNISIAFQLFFICAVLFLGFFDGFLSKRDIKPLSIPAPVLYTDSNDFTVKSLNELLELRLISASPSSALFVDLGLFLQYSWDIETFPYKSVLSEKQFGKPGDTAELTRYASVSQNAQSFIHATQEQIFVFDDVFIADVLKNRDDCSLEKLFIAQEKFFISGYVPVSVTN